MHAGLPRIRDAIDEDAVSVAGLWTEAYVTLGVGGRSTPYSAADFLTSAAEGDVYVVDDLLGMAGVVVLRRPGAPGRVAASVGEAELARLAIASRCRRRGIGRALAEFCHERARRAGWPAIALWSRPRQVEAHRLYEALGYSRLPERDSIDETGQARLVFRVELGAARGTMAG